MNSIEVNRKTQAVRGRSELGHESYCIFQIEKFVRSIIASNEMAYRVDRNNLLVRASKLEDYYCLILKTIDCYSPSTRYGLYVSLYFEVLFKTFNKSSYKSDPNEVIDSGGVRSGDKFNELIIMIRRAGWGINFKRSSDSLERKARRREAEYLNYVDRLFDNCARLMVVRVDLYYARGIDRGGVKCRSEYADTIRLNSDISRLVCNMRHKPQLFSSLEGYIFKLESGDDRGPHVHCLFFFNGATVQKDEWYAKEIGEYWTQGITKGEGDYWNCNADKKYYKKKAVGMIHYADIEMRLNLRYVLSYFCKTDQMIEKVGKSKFKIIRRSCMPEINSSAVGRPRGNRQQAQTKQ